MKFLFSITLTLSLLGCTNNYYYDKQREMENVSGTRVFITCESWSGCFKTAEDHCGYHGYEVTYKNDVPDAGFLNVAFQVLTNQNPIRKLEVTCY